jgi:hypothetical protein
MSKRLFGVELDRAVKMTAKDHKQRWVYHAGHGIVKISEIPIPYRDAMSVYWMGIPACVGYSYRHRKLAHDAMNAI